MNAVARIVSYHRCSQATQDVTLASETLRAAAGREGTLLREIAEVGSGARGDRPGLAEVMGMVKRREVDVVLAWALDRIGRSLIDVLATIATMRAAGVTLVLVSQGLRIGPKGDPAAELTIGVLGCAAQFERSMLIERTKLGLAKARARGVRLGGPRKGTKPMPAQVRELRQDGRSWTDCAKELGCTVAMARRQAVA